MDNPTKEDYMDMEKKKNAMEKDMKDMKDKMAKMEDEKKTDMEKMASKVANMEEENKTHKEKMANMEKDNQTREEKEKNEMANKIAKSEVQSEMLQPNDTPKRLKELLETDSIVLQAMLPYADKVLKEHTAAKEAKQAAMANNTGVRYQLGDQNISEELRIKQAAETKAFTSTYRGAFY